MKRIILTLGLFMMAANLVQAQEIPMPPQENIEKKSPEERTKKHVERLKKELTLTESQEEELYAINLKFEKEMVAFRKEREAMRIKAKAMREAHITEIKNVLNEEQAVKLEKMIEERKAKHKKKHHQEGK